MTIIDEAQCFIKERMQGYSLVTQLVKEIEHSREVISNCRKFNSHQHEVLERIKKFAVKDTRNLDKQDLVNILAAIHSEAFVALDKS